MKTSELTGAALDWAVAKCEDVLERIELEQVNGVWAVAVPDLGCYFEPSTCWTQGGPIIAREKIRLDTTWNQEDGHWSARMDTVGGWWPGPTPLIAAMRCYVASKLGDEVDIPEELI
jgi:hypothetical protein